MTEGEALFNLALAITEAGRSRPDHPAVITDEIRLSFSQLDEAVTDLARGLRASGLQPGDTVALHLPTGVDFVVSFYAILRAGLVAAPFSPQASRREIRHVLELSGARAVVAGESARENVIAACNPSRTALVVADSPLSGGPRASCDHTLEGDQQLSALMRMGRRVSHEATVSRSADDVAAIIFTSGTTGAPKGAELTHANLWVSCTALLSRSEPRADDVVLACLPLHHVFGMSGLMNAAMAWGMTLVLTSRFDAAETLDLIEQHGVTRFSGVPAMFCDMLAAGTGGRDLSSLRHVTSGGSALPVGTVDAFEEMIPSATLLEGYGATETTSSICVNSDRRRRRSGTVGTPSWGTELRVVDEEGCVLPDGSGQTGELQVHGPTVFRGYIGDPEATRQAFDGEWLRTGDLAHIDADGYVHLVDRKKNMIIRGGLNVYPAEIEQVLATMHGVNDVVVLGHPDDRLGEEIAALVIAEPESSSHGDTSDDGELIARLDERLRTELAPYKRPRHIELVDQLPRSAAGKIIRPDAQRLLAERLASTARRPSTTRGS